MKTSKLKDAIKILTSFWNSNLVYNVGIKNKNFFCKEEIVSNKPTIQDAMDAIAILATTVNTLSTTVNTLSTTVTDLSKTVEDGFKHVGSEIARLDKRFDDLYKNNPNLVK